MMSRRVAILCLVFYGFFILSPMLAVWADQLPYEAPRVEQYEPNGTPIIPKEIKVKEVKPKPSSKLADDDVDWVSWGNVGIYTQTMWNVFGVVMPASFGKAYVIKYNLFKEYKVKNGIAIGGRNQIPYWLTRWKWLEKADWTIGRFDIGKWIYQSIDGYQLKLQEYGFADLVKKKYTTEEFNKTQYVKNQQAFHPQMKLGEVVGKVVEEGENTLREAVLVNSEATKKAAWWKLTGKVGMGFSVVITSLDYGIGGNSTKLNPDGSRGPGLNSPEYVAALPLDFAIGAGVALVSSLVMSGIAALAAVTFTITVPATLFVIGVLGVAFFLGLAVENVPFIKKAKDRVHAILTKRVRKTYNSIVRGSIAIVKAGVQIGQKITAVTKQAINWITKKYGG
jgi:hypothetical protein